ncbi:MAG TPA: RNA polymerase sigma factor [Jiangellaceae bacterium]
MARRDEWTPADGEAFATLLAAAHANAPWAFERLFTIYAPRVRAYVRTRGSAEPDELTNDVFFAVFASLAGFTGDEAAFRSWTFTIARNRLVDEHRRRSRQVVTVAAGAIGHDDTVGGDVEAEALANIGSDWVVDVLSGLAPDQRDVLLLRVVADCTIDQIADILGKRRGAVKALQRRGLAAAKRILNGQAVPLDQPADV